MEKSRNALRSPSITQSELPLNLIIAANLDILDDENYLPFANAFYKLLEAREKERARQDSHDYFRINGVILNGNFAAHIMANEGQNYNKFMTMISQYSNRWPLLLNLDHNGELLSKESLSVIEKSFVLGGIGGGEERTAMQGYSFPRKAKIALIETSDQYYSENGKPQATFNRTMDSLEQFFNKDQLIGDEFKIVINRFALVCGGLDLDHSSYDCQRGAENMKSLRSWLTTRTDKYEPIDLYISGHHGSYYRNFPFVDGSFLSLEEDRYPRNQFVSLNEGTGGKGVPIIGEKTANEVIETNNKGFGILTIKGNSTMKDKTVQEINQARDAVERALEVNKGPNASHQQVLNRVKLTEEYLKREDLTEMSLFLLNYKHITLEDDNMLVNDLFRIVTQPPQHSRHQLTTES